MLHLSHNDKFDITLKPDQRYFVWVDIHPQGSLHLGVPGTWSIWQPFRARHNLARRSAASAARRHTDEGRRTPPTLLSLRHSRLLGRHLGLQATQQENVWCGQVRGAGRPRTCLKPWHYALSVVLPRPISGFLSDVSMITVLLKLLAIE